MAIMAISTKMPVSLKMVISTKMTRTVVIRRDYLNWCGKYRTATAS